MKRRNKLTLGMLGLAAVALFASGCTANFCTDIERSRIAYAVEPGVSQFQIEDSIDPADTTILYNEPVVAGSKIHQVVRITRNEEGQFLHYNYSSTLTQILDSAKASSIAIPSWKYFVNLDKKAFEKSLKAYNADHPEALIDYAAPNADYLKACFEDYGYLKFYGNDKPYDGYHAINNEIRNEYGYAESASIDFENFYSTSLNSIVDQYRSCITVYDEVKYGNYGPNGVSIKVDKVTWGDAWGKGGHVIEGLIVYPVAWMVDSFALLFAGGRNAGPAAIQAQYQTGVPQLLSILVVTVIVRLFIFLCTFRSTLAQKKMNELQPELAKIQQKYPNANTNQAQKQRLAEEQMRLYKKHKVNPLSQLLVLIIQFPVFIGVWGAMTGSAVLSTGNFLGLHLSASIWETLKQGPANVANGGWWTALVLIILMSVGQFFSMKLPQWIQKAKTKKVARLGKNPAQQQQNRTANIISYVMLVMIIVMGFTLPAAMGVYWFVGALVSLIQTLFTSVIFAGDRKKRK